MKKLLKTVVLQHRRALRMRKGHKESLRTLRNLGALCVKSFALSLEKGQDQQCERKANENNNRAPSDHII
jgi:hypothetical protein